MFRSSSVLNVCVVKSNDNKAGIKFSITRSDGLKLDCTIDDKKIIKCLKKTLLSDEGHCFQVNFSDLKSGRLILAKNHFTEGYVDDFGSTIRRDSWIYKLVIRSERIKQEAQFLLSQEEVPELLKEIDI